MHVFSNSNDTFKRTMMGLLIIRINCHRRLYSSHRLREGIFRRMLPLIGARSKVKVGISIKLGLRITMRPKITAELRILDDRSLFRIQCRMAQEFRRMWEQRRCAAFWKGIMLRNRRLPTSTTHCKPIHRSPTVDIREGGEFQMYR